MATKTTGEANQTKALRARILLTYIEKYHPKEHALFLAGLGGIPQSFENEQHIQALLQFAEAFLQNHPEDQERLQSISPREMVEEVSQQLVEDAKTRRADIRRRAREIVKTYTSDVKKQKELEDKLVASINASINKAETPQQLRTAIEEEVSKMPLPAEEVVQQLVDADPLSAGHLLLTTPTRDSVVVGHITTLPAPAWRGYVTAVENLQMGHTETVDGFINRAKDVGQTTAFLSADLSQTPVARAQPSSLISAILEAGGDKAALRAFEKLTEEAKNVASLAVVAKAWVGTVDALTKHAGGVLTPALQEVVNQGNKQWGNLPKEPLERVGSLVNDIVNPLLGRTFTSLVELKAINGSLPQGQKILSDKAGVPPVSPQELLLIAAYTWKPEGVWFEKHDIGGSVEPVAWTMRWAADSAFGKIAGRGAKSVGSAQGFFSKILGLFGVRLGTQAAVGAAGGVAGRVATGGLIKILGSIVGVLSGPWGWAVSIVGGVFGAPLLNKAKNWLGNLLSGRVGQLGTVIKSIEQSAGAQGSAHEEQKKTDFMIALVVGVPIIVLITASMFQITTQNSALIEGFYSEPDRFIEDPITYPPPDYLDINALKSKSFPCLSYGAGVSTQQGASRALSGSERAIIENTVENNPTIKALSCALDCSNRTVNVSAFSEGGTYVGYAPSALAGNIVFYPRMFGGFSEQSRARLLAHELAHNIDWFGGGLAEGYYPLSCGPTGKYPWKETQEEAFATAVELYITGNPYIRDFCGGKAYEYFGKTVAQCR